MSEVSIAINGKNYGITCDPGQEGRVADLGAYINNRLEQITSSGAARSETHALVLASLVIADELFDSRTAVGAPAQPAPVQEAALDKEASDALDHLIARVESLTARIESA